jgi:predicted nucleic acid-binding protein
MNYVLDASVALKWVLTERDSDKALDLRDRARRGLCKLLAPDVFPVEIAHALTRAERRGLLLPPEASVLTSNILATAPALYSSIALLPRALEISSQMRIGVYDCLYVALAEEEGCEIVTADDRLLKTLPGFPVLHLTSIEKL